MKIRAGFVSNSSSSSFVIFGVDAKDMTNDEILQFCGVSIYREDYKDQDEYDDCIGYSLYSLRHSTDTKWNAITSEGTRLIGKIFHLTKSADEINDFNVDFEDLEEYANEMEKTFGCKPKLYFGEICS